MLTLCDSCRNHYEDTTEKPCDNRSKIHSNNRFGSATLTPISEHILYTRQARIQYNLGRINSGNA